MKNHFGIPQYPFFYHPLQKNFISHNWVQLAKQNADFIPSLFSN